MDIEDLPRTEIISAFTFEPQDGGVLIKWGDDPLDFVWQSLEQAIDMINKIAKAIMI